MTHERRRFTAPMEVLSVDETRATANVANVLIVGWQLTRPVDVPLAPILDATGLTAEQLPGTWLEADVNTRLIDRGRRTLAAHPAGLRDTLTDQHDNDMARLLAAYEQARVDATRLRTAWHSARRRARSYLSTGNAATQRAISWMSYATDAEHVIRKERAACALMRAERVDARAEVKRLRAAAVDAGREHVAQLQAATAAHHHDARAYLNRAERTEAELERLRAENAAADAATAKWDEEHAGFVAYAQALRVALGEVLTVIAPSAMPAAYARWHTIYGGPIPAPEAHPPVDEYRVQHWEQADADLPSEGWTAISSAQDTAAEATASMRRRRRIRPTLGPLRVIRVRKSYTVVATVDAPEQARIVDTGTYDVPDDTTTTLDASPMTADQWNERYPVGTPVNFCINPGVVDTTTTTRTPAWTLGSGLAVVSVNGRPGGIALTHVEPRQDDSTSGDLDAL